MTLLDKVALVTGGAKRLGREIALALAREGCDVVIHYRTARDEADALAREIRGMGRQAWCVCGDFSNVYEPAVTMRTAWDLAGWIDVLVNNASAYSHDTLADASVERMEELWRVNALAPMLLARTMRELASESRILPADYCGRVVNVLDRTIARATAENLPYWLAKRSLADFTAAAAVDMAPRFTVNAVAPGSALRPEPAGAPDPAGTAPLGRHPGPEAVAEAVARLASVRDITGQILYVDGGLHLVAEARP